MTLDAVRALHPKLGFAVYAFEPGGPVTLEIHSALGQVFSFTAESEQAALLKGFPELAQESVSIFD